MASSGIFKNSLKSYLTSVVNNNLNTMNAMWQFFELPYSSTSSTVVPTWNALVASIAPVSSQSATDGSFVLGTPSATGTTVIETLFKFYNPSWTGASIVSCKPVSVIVTMPDGTPVVYFTLGVTIATGQPVLASKGAAAYYNPGSSAAASFFTPTSTSAPYSSFNYDHNTRKAFIEALNSSDSYGYESKYSSTVPGNTPENRLVQRLGDNNSIYGLLGVAVFSA